MVLCISHVLVYCSVIVQEYLGHNKKAVKSLFVETVICDSKWVMHLQ